MANQRMASGLLENSNVKIQMSKKSDVPHL